MMVKQLRLALVFGLAASGAAAQNTAPRDTRFAGMDTNHDGVITRQEWRGSAQSFAVHDWNNDGILSGDEMRTGGRRPSRSNAPDPFDSADREYTFTDWTARGFTSLDHNRDGRVTRDEWHFDVQDFRRADHNGDGSLSRAEFTASDGGDDDRGDRFANLDENRDGRVSRSEWHGTAERFDRLDENRDGTLSLPEMRGTTEPPPDLFTSVDANRDNTVTRDEWHWSRASFTERDRNRDGRLTREEFTGAETARSEAWRRGHERGLAEGRQAGKEDTQNGIGWDLEGQRELETADSGYQSSFGARADYQGGYREGFRQGYREGFTKR